MGSDSMKLIDIIIIVILAITLGSVIWYIHKSKKNGVKCIGCPDAKNCSGNCENCSTHRKE